MSDPYIVRHRRTTGHGPPANHLKGEIAYSDQYHTLHVGRPDGGSRDIGGALCYIRQELPQRTPGGTFTAGDWRDRPLNTISGNTSFCEIHADGSFTLAPGQYEVLGWAMAVSVQRHRARLTTTDNTVLIWGDSCYGGAWVESRSVLAGGFALANEATIRLQHRCQRTRPTWGFGVWSDWGPEIYVQLTLTRH